MKYICDICRNKTKESEMSPCILDIGEDDIIPEFCPFDKNVEPQWEETNE